MSDNYAGLSIYHKRKIIAANRLGTVSLSYLAASGSNDLCLKFTKNAILYSNSLSDKEVEEEIANLDQLVEKAKQDTNVISMKRKTRSLFR